MPRDATKRALMVESPCEKLGYVPTNINMVKLLS